jgi:uncharacterized protein YbjT (DUF2867 family)
MRVVIFGATGMIGQGVLLECLRDPGVTDVVTIGRRATGRESAKLRELVHERLDDLSIVESELSGFDACFYCLGISSAGLSEDAYRRVTYDLTVAAGQALAKRSPQITFVFVSGTGADSSEQGRVMWARIKGKAENAVLNLPIKASYVFRPAFVRPLDGITSRTRMYRLLYAVFRPLVPVIQALAPGYVTTTEEMGRAMLNVVRHGATKRVLENRDIRAAASETAR